MVICVWGLRTLSRGASFHHLNGFRVSQMDRRICRILHLHRLFIAKHAVKSTQNHRDHDDDYVLGFLVWTMMMIVETQM